MTAKRSPTALDWAWLAGFVDGEGSIDMTRTNDKRRVSPRTLRPCVQIANTDQRAMRRARSILGLEHYAIAVLASATERHAAQYHLSVRELAAADRVLRSLFPYLVIKRMQAALVLDFTYRRLCQRGRGRHAPYCEQDHRVWRSLRELNRRGVRAWVPDW